MNAYDQIKQTLQAQPKTWLVTGAAGFVGSNLVEALLKLDQRVTGLDNFATGKRDNLGQVRGLVAPAQWGRLDFREGDICDLQTCQEACRGVDYVLHQAALGSVPRSIEQPLRSHASNVTGFVNMLESARDQRVKRMVYASSSSVYGDSPELPKREANLGEPLSPYAVTKYVNEIYARVFARCYGLETIGLRYFNVFGPRQDPEGAYAAVIPKWIAALVRGEPVCIHGDGETSRDFCYVENVAQANILAATSPNPESLNQVYNVAVHARTTLNQLFQALQAGLAPSVPAAATARPIYGEFRPGDVRHSLADISRARQRLGYEPTHDLALGLSVSLDWYRRNL